MKTYFHVDMDAFFVSVEELFDPSLRGKPVVVGGKADQRGVVSAASYAARKFGLHSAMPLRTAYRLCPQAIFVDGHPERYRDYSRKVYKVLKSFSPQVEMASVDEAYMDLTGTEKPARAAARSRASPARRHQARDGAQLFHRNRRVAHGGQGRLRSGQAERRSLGAARPGGALPGAARSPQNSRRRQSHRKESAIAGAFARWAIWPRSTKSFCASISANGDWRWPESRTAWTRAAGSTARWARRAIRNPSATKFTFNEDTADSDVLESTLARLSEMVGRRLREHRLHARTVQLKLRYSDFTTITRAHSLDHATQLDTEIFQQARALVPRQSQEQTRRSGCWACTPRAWNPAKASSTCWTRIKTKRWRKALSAVDQIRDKFGEDSVSLATGFEGPLPRARPRKSSRPARQDAGRGMIAR